MKTGNGFGGTIEFFPEEGKYHLDGHRKCGVRLNPEETFHLEGICPVCHRPLTVGVLNRIYAFSDRSTPRLSKAFHSLIPLPEILSEILGCGPATRKVTRFYEKLLSDLGPELEILMNIPGERLETAGGPVLAEAVKRMRCNQVICDEGYDGHFGTIRLFRESEKATALGQTALFAASTLNPPVAPPPRPIPPRKKLRQRRDQVRPAHQDTLI
ncbi:MAG: AAA family ATPase, partial [Deltaproteobacteria bacterium]|nr:AAA family ATPase [Deltaproteobacteria bacterium]